MHHAFTPLPAAVSASAFPLTPCDQADDRCLFRRVQEVEERLRRRFGDIAAMKAGDEVLRTGLRLLDSGQARQMLPAERAAYIWRTAELTARRTIARERCILQLDAVFPASDVPQEEDEDFLNTFRAALDQLPEPHRVAITLHLLDGLSFKKAAVALGVSVGTVRHRVKGGCKLLRVRLRDSAHCGFLGETRR